MWGTVYYFYTLNTLEGVAKLANDLGISSLRGGNIVDTVKGDSQVRFTGVLDGWLLWL